MLFMVFACKKNGSSVENGVPFDPSKPVTIERYTPDSGGAKTQMVIYGSNFGTDVSQIHVYVNDEPAPVIGSSGSVIYAMVPSRAGTGDVRIVVGEGANTAEAKAGSPFNYIFRPMVSTLSGFTNDKGESSIVDGGIKEAQYEAPFWLCFDQHKNIYILETQRGMRVIDSALTTVRTLFRTGNGFGFPRTMAFSPTWDTIYITNNQDTKNGISSVILTAISGFTRWTALSHGQKCMGGDVQPQTGDFFISSATNGQVYKWERATKSLRELYKVGDNSWEFNIQFAPSGDFAYIVVVNKHYILKANYNRQTRELESPVHFVGERASSGYKDGVGTGAKFNEMHQGAFDEFDNFYVCDRLNSVIRKITPDGVVTTFAGRPGSAGYADGPLRDAQFKRPQGIIYDQDKGVFYVADQNNKCIRTITTE